MNVLFLPLNPNFILATVALFALASFFFVRRRHGGERAGSQRQAASFSDLDEHMQLAEKLQLILRLGTERLGLGQAVIVSLVDGHRLNALELYASDYRDLSLWRQEEALRALELYCDRLRGGQDLLAIDCASLSHWRNYAAYRRFGIETYIGVPLRHNDRFFGMLCFFDERSREGFFSSSEKEFVREMGRWVDGMLAQEEEGTRKVQENITILPAGVAVNADIFSPSRVEQ